MGPAVTLEKSTVGAKRYLLPPPQFMPNLAQSARRHSGTVPGRREGAEEREEGARRKPLHAKNLRRQYSFDSVLGKGKAAVCFRDDPETRRRVASLPEPDVPPEGDGEPGSKFPSTSFKDVDRSAQTERGAHAGGRSTRGDPGTGDESTESASSHGDVHDILRDLDSGNARLTQRVTALMKRVKHVQSRGMRSNFEKYLRQLQGELRRQGVPLKSSISPEASSGGSPKVAAEEMLALDGVDSRSPTGTRYGAYKEVSDAVRGLVGIVDPDATDESSSESEAGGGDAGEGVSFRDINHDWIMDQAVACHQWHRYKRKVSALDREIAATKSELRRHGRSRGEPEGSDIGLWSARVSSDTTRIVLTRAGAARCAPQVPVRKRKLVFLGSPSVPSPSLQTERSDASEDPYGIAETLLRRWSSPDSWIGSRDWPRASGSSDRARHSRCDSPSARSSDVSQERTGRIDGPYVGAQKSRSSTKPKVRAGAEGQRRAQASSSYDINDVVLIPTNSSTLPKPFSGAKEIDVPMWRFANCPVANQMTEFEDTSDEAYARRHLEPEVSEKKHRIPEVSRRSRGGGGPGRRRRQDTCSSLNSDPFSADDRSRSAGRATSGEGSGGGKRPSGNGRPGAESPGWSSVSHRSDEKSLDGASWTSVDSVVPPFAASGSRRIPDVGAARVAAGVAVAAAAAAAAGVAVTTDDSCSTASALSPLNSDL